MTYKHGASSKMIDSKGVQTSEQDEIVIAAGSFDVEYDTIYQGIPFTETEFDEYVYAESFSKK